MPRAKGGAKTRRRRKKILKKAKGYFGGRRDRAARGRLRVPRAQAEETRSAEPLDRPDQRRLPGGGAVLLALHGRAQEGRNPSRSQGAGGAGGDGSAGVREAHRDRQSPEPVVRGSPPRRRHRPAGAGRR